MRVIRTQGLTDGQSTNGARNTRRAGAGRGAGVAGTAGSGTAGFGVAETAPPSSRSTWSIHVEWASTIRRARAWFSRRYRVR